MDGILVSWMGLQFYDWNRNLYRNFILENIVQKVGGMMEKVMEKVESILVGIDISKGKDKTVLVVGRKWPNQSVDIINIIEGEEALALYKRLIEKKGVTL